MVLGHMHGKRHIMRRLNQRNNLQSEKCGGLRLPGRSPDASGKIGLYPSGH